MGAQWKHAGRIENSNKRGAIISKLVKEITVATKAGDPHPENNSRLRVAIETAKKHSVPRDTIERAIKKGAGLLNEAQYESVFYEGFAPHRVPVIVECLTDNKNRTAAEIRVLFRKGHLESIGSVTWMFDRLGIIEATFAKAGMDIEEAAIEAGAQNVEALEADSVQEGQTGARFYCEPTDLDKVNKALAQFGWNISQSEIGFMAKNKMTLSEAQITEVTEFLDAIDDDQDVHRVYAGL